jgi:wyosine [tRNA(Phe)-imidazoG37] synthetase (radical SAM superfamily)
MRVERRAFYAPDEIVRDVREKVEKARVAGEAIDYLTFVPDGEPTLDLYLGHEIESLRPLGIPIAVITNASLLWREDVREELMGADWVSLKVDAARESIWRQVDRARGSLRLFALFDGVRAFAGTYPGTLVTETMLVGGLNDSEACVRELSGFLAHVQPSIAYLSVPTRPPAEHWVHAPDEEALNRAYQVLSAQVGQVEYLIGYEGNAFAFTGDVEQDLLSITAVHPMRADAVNAFLARAGAGWDVIRRLLVGGQLIETEYGGSNFYLRKLKRSAADAGSNPVPS